MRDFFKFIVAEAGEEPTSAELLIFSQIGEWEDMGDVSARIFAKELAKLPTSVKRIDLHINSPGGSVFEAQGIYSRLADHRSQKIVYIDGLAASAASIVAMVGHKIYIRANANIMVHLPSGIQMGNADDMRHMATALDSITESMINVYAKRTSLERDEVRSMLAAETWMSPEMAVEKGFADEVRGVVKAAAVVGDKRAIFNGLEFDLSHFNNVPAFTASTPNKGESMSKPKAETAEATPPKEKKEEKPTGEQGKEEAPPETTEEQTIPKKPAAGTEELAEKMDNDYDRGIKAERERVTALQKLDRPATHEIVIKAIAEGKQPSDIAAECIEAMDKARGNDARHADARSLDGIPPANGAEAKEEDAGALLTKKVKARLQARGQSTVLLNQGRN